jgi:glycosyltransferase involved in cell wall biosynthesis
VNGNAKRLLIVTSRFPFGNAESFLDAELAELATHFERIAVLPVRTARAPRRALPPRVETLAWPAFDLDLARRAAWELVRTPRAAAVVFDVLRSRDPGRVKNVAVIVKALALARWIVENGFDHVHAYWLSTPATVAMIAARVARVGWSATAHRWDIYERNAFDVKARSAQFVRAISARGARDVRERMPQLAERVVHLRLGTNVPAAGAIVRTVREPFEIVCPAALVPVKGHEHLLDAIALLRARGVPVRCTIAGDGPLREALEAQSERLGIGAAVRFAGFVPQPLLIEQYRSGAYRAVVLASRADGPTAMEGVPCALIEAMACGVPVVATDSGSVGELIDAQRGWLVPASSADDLASALLELYRDPAQAQLRARNARAFVEAEHDVRVQMRTLAAALGAKERV